MLSRHWLRGRRGSQWLQRCLQRGLGDVMESWLARRSPSGLRGDVAASPTAPGLQGLARAAGAWPARVSVLLPGPPRSFRLCVPVAGPGEELGPNPVSGEVTEIWNLTPADDRGPAPLGVHN